MAVLGQKWLYWGKVVVFRAEMVVFGKVVVFRQKLLYSGKVVVFGQSGCVPQVFCIPNKWLVFGTKMVVLR